MANPNGRIALSPEQHIAQSIVMIPFSGCHIWMKGLDTSGYGNTKQHGKPVKAHRLAWTLKHGEIPSGKHIMHSCDTPSCCNPEHLSLGTVADNMADKARKGRAAKKLDAQTVMEIRKERGSNHAVARKYGISHGTVSDIRLGVTWRHLETEQ